MTEDEWKDGRPEKIAGRPYHDYIARIPKEIDGLAVEVAATSIAVAF